MTQREHTTLKVGEYEQAVSYIDQPGETGTLLYMHGVGCSADDFAPAADRPELAGYRLLALDLPGSGGSPYPEDRTVGMKDLAALLNAFIVERAAEKFTLIAHSMGAVVAVRYLQHYPGEARQFVNVEGSNAMWSESKPFLAHRIGTWNREAFVKLGFGEQAGTFASSPYTGFHRHAEIMKTTSPQAYYDYNAALLEEAKSGDLLDVYTQLPLPRLFVYGADNEDQRQHVTQLEGVGIETAAISGSHHFPFYDNPDEYYKILGAWLQR